MVSQTFTSTNQDIMTADPIHIHDDSTSSLTDAITEAMQEDKDNDEEIDGEYAEYYADEEFERIEKPHHFKDGGFGDRIRTPQGECMRTGRQLEDPDGNDYYPQDYYPRSSTGSSCPELTSNSHNSSSDYDSGSE